MPRRLDLGGVESADRPVQESGRLGVLVSPWWSSVAEGRRSFGGWAECNATVGCNLALRSG